MGDYTMIERTYNIEDNELYNDYEYLYDVLDHTLKNQNNNFQVKLYLYYHLISCHF